MPYQRLKLGTIFDAATPDFATGDGQSPYGVNWYHDGKAFRRIPGNLLFGNTATGLPCFGAYYSAKYDRIFTVSSGAAYAFDSAGTKTTLSGSDDITELTPARFAEDGNYVYMVANSKVHRLTATTIEVLSASPDNCRHVAWTGGYILVDSGTVAGDVSYSDDGGATWEVFNNEQNPDGLAAIAVVCGDVAGIGTRSYELSYIDGTTPFALNQSATQTFGSIATYSTQVMADALYFLAEIAGSRHVVKMASGRQPSIVSGAISLALSELSRVDDAISWVSSFRGRSFYAIQFPSASLTFMGSVVNAPTFAYDATAGVWALWNKWDGTNSEYIAPRATGCVTVPDWRKTVICATDGKLYEMSPTTYTDGGDVHRLVMRSGWLSYDQPALTKVSDAIYYHVMRGTNTSTTVDYYMNHRWRDGHSMSWSNGRAVSLGLAGQSKSPRKQTRYGQYKVRQHEIEFSGVCDFVLEGVYEDASINKMV